MNILITKIIKTRTLCVLIKDKNLITIQKRFSGKKAADELAKITQKAVKKGTCIGAGCPSTRPFMQTMNTSSKNSEVSSTNNTKSEDTFQKAEQKNSKDNEINIEAKKKQDFNKTMVTTKDKYHLEISNTPLKPPKVDFMDKTKELDEKVREQYKDVFKQPFEKRHPSLVEAMRTPWKKDNTYPKFSSTQNPQKVEANEECSVVDSVITEAFPISPIPSTSLKPFFSTIELEKKIVETRKEREAQETEIIQNLQQLEYRGLFKIENNEEKLTRKYQTFTQNSKKNYMQIDVNAFQSNNNTVFDIGILEVTRITETVLLSGTHKHVVVVYAFQNNKQIVLGYLTSSRNNNTVKLSDTQPFIYENNNKKQYFATLKETLLVLEAEHIKKLSSCTLQNGTKIDQQQVGHHYINEQKIHHILQEEMKNKVIPKIQKANGFVEIYDGRGVTLENIKEVLTQDQKDREINVKNYLLKYKNLKMQQQTDRIQIWLKGLEKTEDKKTLEELKQCIKDYDNKTK